MSIKKNFIYNFLLTGSNLLFPLLTFPYLSRIIGAEGLGISNFILSYCQNYIIIAALGLPVYGVREIARLGDDKEKRSKLFFELISLHLIFTGILFIIYTVTVLLSPQFHEYKNLALLGGGYIMLSVFTIEWLFSGVNDFKYITIRSIIIRSLSVLAIFIFVRQKDDFNVYFIITVITLFLTVLVNVNYARKYVSLRSLSQINIRHHLKSVSVLGIYVILTSIYSVIPVTLLGFFSTKSAVGYYYGANKIIRMVISFFTALTTVMIPKLNLVLEMKGRDEYKKEVQKSLSFVITFGIPITFLVFLLANPLIMLLAGKEFQNSIFCIQMMAPVILSVAFAQVFVILILSINRRETEMVLLSALGMVISLIINIIFIPGYGERATAVSQFSAELAVTVVSFFLAKRCFDFNFPIQLFLLNVLFVLPFLFFTHVCLRLTNNIFLQLLFSGASCGSYFIFYQWFIVKDKFLIGLIEPYLKRLKN